MKKLEKLQITDKTIFVTDESFKLKMFDEYHQFGYLLEIFNIHTLVGSKAPSDVTHPYTIDCGIMLESPSEKFSEKPDKDWIPSREERVRQANYYCGTVSVEQDFIKMYNKMIHPDLNIIESMVTNGDAILVNPPQTSLGNYDKFAKLIYFNSEQTAKKYINEIMSVAREVSSNVEEILDRVINLDGTDGRSIIYSQLIGPKYHQSSSMIN